jgi:hypothetical protein
MQTFTFCPDRETGKSLPVDRQNPACWHCGQSIARGSISHLHIDHYQQKYKYSHPMLKAYKLNKGAKNGF